MKRKTIALLATLVLLALFPFAGATFYTELVTKVMILAIFALSLDLLVGYTGLVSFGHVRCRSTCWSATPGSYRSATRRSLALGHTRWGCSRPSTRRPISG